MKTVLLHSCCAPCSAAIIEWLLTEGVRPVLFYFNPNIYPQPEYDIRKSELIRYASLQGVDAIDGGYDHINWLQHVFRWENEPERGARCLLCFRMRLLATARLAKKMGIDLFATTLASSRWKDLNQIAQSGHWAAAQYDGVEFLEKNWRKDGLSERRNELLKINGFYNQLYCGCEFSIKKN